MNRKENLIKEASSKMQHLSGMSNTPTRPVRPQGETLLERYNTLMDSFEALLEMHQKIINENHVVPKDSEEVTLIIGKNKLSGTLHLR
jgi:hypothetical protein